MIIKNVNQIQEQIIQEDLMDNISIIIRNRNEAEHIGFALQSVIDHYNEPEIIIIDNESIDDSLKVVSLFDNCNIKVYTLSKYTPGKAINLGVKHATRDNILVLSAHCQISKVISLDKISNYLKDYVAIMGNQVPIHRGNKITKRYIWSHFGDKIKENIFSSIEDRYFLHNAFCYYNRDFLLNNPFDERYWGKEDRHWAIKMVGKNYKYLYTPKMSVNHFWTSNGATWKGLG
jgi:rhamnosyltransferase